MSPSVERITQLLEANIVSHTASFKESATPMGLTDVGDLAQSFSDDIHFSINGREFALAQEVKGLDNLNRANLSSDFPALHEIIDKTKPIRGEVVRVIGGGDGEWAAAVLKYEATTTKGKAFNHESVVTIKFNDRDQICALKIYADTLHLHNALV